jgi:hypothetical protein
MDDSGPGPDDEHVGNDDEGTASETGLTLEAYALGLSLPANWLKTIGLSTIDNPWIPGRSAVAIPYRQRDGALFRNRVRQAVRPVDAKRSRVFWDRQPEKLGRCSMAWIGCRHRARGGCWSTTRRPAMCWGITALTPSPLRARAAMSPRATIRNWAPSASV